MYDIKKIVDRSQTIFVIINHKIVPVSSRIDKYQKSTKNSVRMIDSQQVKLMRWFRFQNCIKEESSSPN